MRLLVVLCLFVISFKSFASDDFDAPLDDATFKAVASSFAKDCKTLKQRGDIPEEVKLQDDIFLILEEVNSHSKSRQISSRTSFFKIKKKNAKVGEVVLVESTDNSHINGKFALHLIKIFDSYTGEGIGGAALDLTVLLARELSQYSTFYNSLSLQCSDYDEKGEHLGSVPYRLSYYLNRGFHIDEKTLGYMRYLDLGHFIHNLTNEMFAQLLEDYIENTKENFESSMEFSHQCIKNHSEELLVALKQNHKENTDYVLQVAESNSSLAGEIILNRLYYDSVISEEEYEKTGAYIYLMGLNVNDWEDALIERRKVKEERASTDILAPGVAELQFDLNERRLLRKVMDLYASMFQESSETKVTGLDPDSNRPRKKQRIS